MSKTVFATIGRECGLVHYYQLQPSPMGMTLRETAFDSNSDVKLLYFDEATDLDIGKQFRANDDPAQASPATPEKPLIKKVKKREQT